MDAAPLTRIRWRLRGAWLWPSFVILLVADAAIASWRPAFADHGSVVSGALEGWIPSLAGVAILSPALGWGLRQFRTDMPKVVARDYAGTAICVLVTCFLLAAGLIHHPVVVADQNALDDASANAEAYIGDHAPQRFLPGLRSLSTYQLQPPVLYRVCARASASSGSAAGASWYCVVVNLAKPFGASVRYDGSESNALISQGTY
jgi:hypothetical protein